MKNIIISATVFTLVCVAVFLIISFTWVGAEYIIENRVNYGTVDRCVAGLLTIYVLNWIASYSKKHPKHSEEGKNLHKEIPESNVR